MSWNGPLEPVIYDDEDADALLAEFIALCVQHKITERKNAKWQPEKVGDYAFKKLGCRNIGLRGEQAGQIWFDRLEVLDKIIEGIAKGPVKVVETVEELTNRALQIASDGSEAAKDRLTAIRLAAELQEFIGAKGAGGGRPASNDNSADFLSRLSKALPN